MSGGGTEPKVQARADPDGNRDSETRLVPMGLFTSEEVTVSGPPDTRLIRAKRAVRGGPVKEQKTPNMRNRRSGMKCSPVKEWLGSAAASPPGQLTNRKRTDAHTPLPSEGSPALAPEADR